MTDAREIIAKAVSVARGETPIGGRWANLSLKDRDTAELGVRRVVAAGFRILGPDDVDQVTVEKCAEIADSLSETWSNSRDAYQAVQEAAASDKAHEIADTIRSIGRRA